ncbi:DUF4240 domain-containing protein [Actinoplanes sp. L3-i22]|uniref:DUF4240 domain-containing protein n=1 Tax=Actinoplanes sp. L3-i22 TaxID=2836373 RepID=UPI001C855DB8|nr:DUF4240 domain-containing protein [Actinoplanes sp. L3-i22]
MDIDGFWAIIEGSRRGTDPAARGERITQTLAGLSVADLLDFHDHLDEQMGRVDGDLMGEAAALILCGCGDDSFCRFQAWLVGLGRSTLDRVAGDPDLLADEPEVRRLAERHPRDWPDEEYPWFEELEFAAVHEYERRELDPKDIYAAVRARDSESSVSRRGDEEVYLDPDVALPRLTAMFGGRMWD